MKDKEFKRRIIHHLAEERVPANYNPWEVMQRRLADSTANHKIQSRATLSRLFESPHSLRLAFLAVILLVGLVFSMTPPGKAIAQSIVSLFTRAESDVRLLPAGQHTEELVLPPSAVPTQIVEVQVVTPGSSFWTPTPALTTQSGSILYGLSLREAAALSKFVVAVPADLPDGYTLADVLYNPGLKEVVQIYKYRPYQSGEMFLLSQRTSLPEDAIGQSAEVEQIMVGDVLVEKVSGSWFSHSGSTSEQWEADAPLHTYRWQKDGYTFTLEFWVNDTFSPAYLSNADMQAVVEVTLGARSTLPDRVHLNNLKSIDELLSVSEQPVLAPTILPEGFIFSYAAYEPGQRVVLIYEPEEGTRSSGNASLVIFEMPGEAVSGPVSYDGFPEDAVETVPIGVYTGTLVRGAVVDGVYDPDLGISLTWDTAELRISIRFQSATSYAARLEPTDLVAIAESMQ